MGIRRSVLYIVPGGEKSHHLIQFGSVLFFFISFICSYDGASKSISWQIIPKAKTNLIVGNKFWQRNPKRLTKNYNIQHAEIKFISFLAFFTEINQTVTRLQRLTILKMEWFHFCGVQHKLLLNHIDICVCFVFCNEKSLAYNLQHTKVNEDDLHEKKNRAAFMPTWGIPYALNSPLVTIVLFEKSGPTTAITPQLSPVWVTEQFPKDTPSFSAASISSTSFKANAGLEQLSLIS